VSKNKTMKKAFYIIVALIAFAVGVNVKNSFISPFNATSKSEEAASTSAQVSADRANLPQVSNESAPAATTPGSLHSQNGNTYTSQNLEDKVIISGLYKLSSYNVNFNITLPKNGGPINGSLSGTCDGTITGNASKPDDNGNGMLEGQYSGDCKPIPTLSFKTHASGTFTGNVQFKDKKAQITINNKEPFPTGSWFELFF